MSDTRFTIGKTYTFMRVLFTKTTPRWSNLYYPWEDTLNGIETMELECIEHHKVSDDWSDEKRYDGFVFRAPDGMLWDNQYPTACYGQLDDTNDRVVFMRMDLKAVYKHDEFGAILDDEEGKHIIIDQELHDKHDSTFFESRFELCTNLLGNLYRSVNPRERDKSHLTENQRKLLGDFLDEVVKKVEQSNNKKVYFEPLVFKYTDGKPDKVSDYFIARIR